MAKDSGLPSEEAWRDLYRAALFEADSAKLPQRITEAEYALSVRDRQLWYSGGDHTVEKLAMTGAMRALEALRSIHQCPRAAARSYGISKQASELSGRRSVSDSIPS